MARNNPIPYIPKQPLTVQADRKATQVAALLGNVGALVKLGADIQTSQQQEENQKQAALLKIQQLGIDENKRASVLQKQEEARGLQRVEQASRYMQRQFEQATNEIEQNEKLGIYHAVNSLRETQLTSANARGLGFTTPDAIVRTDQAIGERKANLDFPRLLQSIEMDERKLPSEHLQRFLQGQSLGSDEAATAYAATLADRLDVYEKNAMLSRAEKARAVAVQNAVDGFQYNIATGFRSLDEEQFQTALSSLHRGLKAANKDITEQEFKAAAVSALEPLFVGPDARFSASEGLLKLGELFSPEEAERFGLGGVFARLSGEAQREYAGSVQAGIKNAQTFEQLQGAILAANTLEQQGLLSGLKAVEFRTDAQKQLQKIRASEEVRNAIERGGEGIIPLTDEHEDAMNNATDSRGIVGAEAALFQTRSFGRLSKRTLEQMDAMATSVDGQQLPEAVAMWQAVAQANPSYAYQLTLGKNSPLPEKLSALALDAQARGTGALQSGAQVPEQFFDTAASIYDKPPEDVTQRDATLQATGFLWWGQPEQTVANAEQQRAFRSIAISYMARAQNNGQADQAALYRDATRYAQKQISKVYTPLKIAGQTYAVRNEVAGVLRQTERTFDNVQSIARQHMREIRSLQPGGDFVYDFGNAKPAGGKLIIPLLQDGEQTNSEHWLKISLDPAELDVQANGPKLHPYEDTNRAFNKFSEFPAIGRWLYGVPEEESAEQSTNTDQGVELSGGRFTPEI